MNTQPTIKNFLVIILPAILTVFIIFFLIMPQVRENREKNKPSNITNFEECVSAGNPVMESYPRQCAVPNGQTFTEEIDEPLIGGDTDEHDCLISAGYSWCEPKSKCLRVWEEACYGSVAEEIQYILANKYDKPVSEVAVDITKQTENHVAGGVKFGQGDLGEGGMFLARKAGNMWELVYDGNGSVDCEKMRTEYEFPDEILLPNFCD